MNDSYFTLVSESESNQLAPLDVGSILDCILDDNFYELEIHVPFQTINSFSLLLSIIAHRSPKLEDLKIVFYDIKELKTSLPEPTTKKRKLEPFDSNSSLRLQHLTSLSLVYTADSGGSIGAPLLHLDYSGRESILSFVGQLCPSLAKLLVRGFCFRKQDMFGLILGDMADVLFPLHNKGWGEDAVLENLWIPKEVLNPLCSSLQKLEFFCCNFPSCICYDSFPQSAYACAFRHLRNLKSVTFNEYISEDEESPRLSMNPELLQLLKKERVECQQQEFEAYCQTAAAYTGSEMNSTVPLTYVSGERFKIL